MSAERGRIAPIVVDLVPKLPSRSPAARTLSPGCHARSPLSKVLERDDVPGTGDHHICQTTRREKETERGEMQKCRDAEAKVQSARNVCMFFLSQSLSPVLDSMSTRHHSSPVVCRLEAATQGHEPQAQFESERSIQTRALEHAL